MSTAIQRRRGTTTEHGSFAGLEGEITVDTTKDTAVVHDASTAGGRPLLREDLSNLAADAITNTHMAVNSIDSDQYVDGSIDNAHLADDAVGSDELANNVVINTSGAITTTGAFTSVGIDDNADATAITIDSSERVGINAPSPAYKMDIRGTGNDTFQIMNGAGAYARIAPDSNGANADIRLDFAGGSGSETGVALIIRANGGEKFRVQGSGDTTIQGDLKVVTDKGINFYGGTDPDAGATASVTSNTLDDYEEGTWLGAFTAATSGTITIGYPNPNPTGYNTGSYTKIGRLVTVSGDFYVAAVSAPVGEFKMTGLPFATANTLPAVTGVTIYPYGLASGVSYVVGFITQNSTEITMRKFAAGTTAALAGDVIVSTTLRLSLSYITA